MSPRKAPKSGYRLLDHTADVGVTVFGRTKKTLYESAAAALFSLILEDIPMEKGITEDLFIDGSDAADLMVNWLRELFYLWAGKGQVVLGSIVKKVSSRQLSATIRTSPYDAKRHAVKNDIKAVTYHQVRVAKTPAGWEAKIVFDV